MRSQFLEYPARKLLMPLLVVIALIVSPQGLRAQSDANPFSRQELAQMLAPVALYPDVVLSQILMASTYPIEVIEADRWMKRNPELQGGELDRALLEQDWDPSVKELCHLAPILALMSERIAETTDLGNAFLAQEDEVMAVVQELRSKAYERGRLRSTDRHRVVLTESVIIIEPVDPRVIYIPYYDPCYVFDPWWYPPCPPYYWAPSGVRVGVSIGYWPGFYFGFSFGTWSSFDWHRHVIYVDVYKRPRFVRQDRWIRTPGRWVHAPVHRHGVAYRDRSTAVRFGQPPARAVDVRREERRIYEERLREQHKEREKVKREWRKSAPGKVEKGKPERIRLEEERRGRERSEKGAPAVGKRDQKSNGTKGDKPRREKEQVREETQKQERVGNGKGDARREVERERIEQQSEERERRERVEDEEWERGRGKGVERRGW